MHTVRLLLFSVVLGLSSCAPQQSIFEQWDSAYPGGWALPEGTWVGRRYYVEGVNAWGYVKRPQESWLQAKQVVFLEKERLAPDRPERDGSGPVLGSDHGYIYRLEGYFSGRKVYDPNINRVLPEFVLRDYSIIKADGLPPHGKKKR